MPAEKVDFAKAKAAVSADDKPDDQRQQSTIGFPLYDLASAEEVARHVYERTGLSECPLDELAAQSRSTMSGTFRMRTRPRSILGLSKSGDRRRFSYRSLDAGLCRQSRKRKHGPRLS